MIVSNPTSKPDLDKRSLVTLGDTLGGWFCITLIIIALIIIVIIIIIIIIIVLIRCIYFALNLHNDHLSHQLRN